MQLWTTSCPCIERVVISLLSVTAIRFIGSSAGRGDGAGQKAAANSNQNGRGKEVLGTRTAIFATIELDTAEYTQSDTNRASNV